MRSFRSEMTDSPWDCSCSGVPPYGARPPSRPSRYVATLKKLSALRKYPVRGRRAPRTSRRCLCSTECDARVDTVTFRLPPSALKPAATAIASTSVDLPLPFSPRRGSPAGGASARGGRGSLGSRTDRPRSPRFRRASGQPSGRRDRPDFASAITPLFVLREARLDELGHERLRKRLVRLKLDRAFAELVGLQFSGVR